MKQVFIFCLLLCAASSLFALDLSIGIGAEVNANTRSGAAAGGILSFGLELNDLFSAGLVTAFSHNFDSVFTLEPRAFFRYYLPFKIDGLFAQAEFGTSIFIEEDSAYPAVSGGIAAGWRYLINQNFYIEPYLRAGYPFIWGAGLTGGIILPLTKESANSGGRE